MAFTSYDTIVAALAAGNGQSFPWMKQSITTTTARWYSLFKSAGNPAAGSTPASGSGAAATSATTGAFPIVNPSGVNLLRALTYGAGGGTAGMSMIYDRLVHTSGLVGNLNTAQTINSAALTRYTTGVGVMCALEVYTAIGSTPTTATISYTNQAGVAGQISGTITIPATLVAQSMVFPFPLAAGDTGIQSVQSLTLAASTGTAGNIGITLYYPLAMIAWNANGYNERDLILQTANLPEVKANACLALASYATASTLGDEIGTLILAQG